jgi:3-methyladenine DNA glycosylase AlkC
MPEALKDLYTKELIVSLCKEFVSIDETFESAAFQKRIFDTSWDARELKDRMRHISETLHDFLPGDYREALRILKLVSPRFEGFEYMFIPGYVELYGLDDFEESVVALERFTEFASSEFAVRPFIKKYPGKMMKRMEEWCASDNHHVRRLASEGCRPRLPWAMALPGFKKDPGPVIRILKKLRRDESEYVRRSVANNLNDISKDHPQIVIDLAGKWIGRTAQLDWIVKHGCRSLLKQGVVEALELFGLEDPKHVGVEDFHVDASVRVGGALRFSFELVSKNEPLGKLRVEYFIDFVKKNGASSRKIFKISEAHYPAQSKGITRKHSFRIISTRNYYEGVHGVGVIVNGRELICGTFQLAP